MSTHFIGVNSPSSLDFLPEISCYFRLRKGILQQGSTLNCREALIFVRVLLFTRLSQREIYLKLKIMISYVFAGIFYDQITLLVIAIKTYNHRIKCCKILLKYRIKVPVRSHLSFTAETS